MSYKYDLFVSYSREDKEWVAKLIKALDDHGVDVWHDEKILAGEKFVSAIAEAIRSSWAIAVVVSKASLNSSWVKEEYEYALVQDINENRTRPVIPLKLDGTAIPGFLGHRSWILFEDPREFEEGVIKLVDAIRAKHPTLTELTGTESTPPLDEIIRQARKTLLISGHTLDKFSTDVRVRNALSHLFERGTSVTLVLLNPYSSYAKAHEPFHILESRGSSQDQIMGTIRVLKYLVAQSRDASKNLNVLLSNYMPRFRTILVDDSILYVGLYMYGEDVGEAPEVMLRKGEPGRSGQWFRTIRDSLNKLLKSKHVVHLIQEGKFNESWKSIRIREMLLRCPELACCRTPPSCWDEVRDVILAYPKGSPRLFDNSKIISMPYEPGTYRLDEISSDSDFLYSPENFDSWVENVIRDDLELIKQQREDLLYNSEPREIIRQVISALSFIPPAGKSLKQQIWVQEYSDIIRRLLFTILAGDPEYDLILYPNLSTERRDFIFSVIDWIEKSYTPRLEDWLYLSVAAGLLGIDEKPTHAATSHINSNFGIMLNRKDMDNDVEVKRVSDSLWKAANTSCRIDASEAFFAILDLHRGSGAKIVSFPDDFLETIVLLKYYEKLLIEYPRLRIDCVPRSSRCSNDATYEDVLQIRADMPILRQNRNFKIHPNGPKIGGVNLNKLHPNIIQLLEEATIVDVRGARSYEMMQGIWPETYFGFMVCREISESVIGYPSEERPFVYIRQKTNQHSFKDFRERKHRDENGRLIAEVAAKDSKGQWEGGCFTETKEWGRQRKERYRILHDFYGPNALAFRKRFGDLLEEEVKNGLSKLYGRILVLGCGSGKEVAFLMERGCDAWGIDFSPEAIALAKNDHPAFQHRFILEDIYNTDFVLTGQFNAVVANAALVHLLERDDLKLILKKIWGRLEPEGLVFIRLLDKKGKKEEMDQHLFNSKRWFVYYTEDDIRRYAESSDFKVEHISRHPHVSYEKSGVFWIIALLRRHSQ